MTKEESSTCIWCTQIQDVTAEANEDEDKMDWPGREGERQGKRTLDGRLDWRGSDRIHGCRLDYLLRFNQDFGDCPQGNGADNFETRRANNPIALK